MAKEQFIPLKEIAIISQRSSSEAETLAVRHFENEIERMTGYRIPRLPNRKSDFKEIILFFGNQATKPNIAKLVLEGKDIAILSPDIQNQSYCIQYRPRKHNSSSRLLYVLGLGKDTSARSFLGLSYAFGELIRRLDIRDGTWGFVLPNEPIFAKPQMPSRTLYLMNSNNSNPGLSLEYFNDKEIRQYVDSLIDGYYSRISFWRWAQLYLYPGSDSIPDKVKKDSPDILQRGNKTQQILFHENMKKVITYARKRGLEVYHQLTPVHIDLDLLPQEERFVSTGYYGRTGVCWSQPEGRKLARDVAEFEMKYSAPVDGYVVWFYDPGGCFCNQCKANQAQNLFDQLMLVVELSKKISPKAKFEAVLWPTWCFHEYQNRGIPYTKPEVDAMVTLFLQKCLHQFGPRNLTIMDSCEADNTNVYNGLVNPQEFQRNAFMYSVLGMASEHGYPFAHFRFQYLHEQMSRAKDRGIEEGLIFIQYAATNEPSVFVTAYTCYQPQKNWEDVVRSYASRYAKGEMQPVYLDCLKALEEMTDATKYSLKDKALTRAEKAWNKLESSPYFYGNKSWLKGYILAQRYYLQMAQAKDEQAKSAILDKFKKNVGEIQMYKDYMINIKPALIDALHLHPYWVLEKEDKIIEFPK